MRSRRTFFSVTTPQRSYDAFVTDALVFAAVAFVVLDRTKNALAKQAVTFWLVSTVVDRLGLQHFAV